MSTIGHPLSDLANLLTPYVTAKSGIVLGSNRSSKAFRPDETPGLPTQAQLVSWYREAAGWNPAPDLTWGEAFGIYRSAIIMQGIAARYALRQASSANAKNYAVQMPLMGELAWSLVEEAKRKHQKAKL